MSPTATRRARPWGERTVLVATSRQLVPRQATFAPVGGLTPSVGNRGAIVLNPPGERHAFVGARNASGRHGLTHADVIGGGGGLRP